MPQNRFYTKDISKTTEQVILEGDEHHHLKNVMRVQLGEEVELINGDGLLAKAIAIDISKTSSTFEIKAMTCRERPRQKKLALALLKGQKLNLVIEKCTELGIDEFLLFDTKNSEKKGLSNSQEQRFKKLIVSATKQSGRLYLPNITYFTSLEKLLETDNHFCLCDFAQDSLSPIEALKKENLGLIVGPEKGFHESEKILAREYNLPILSLHENILRAETAGILAAAYLSLQL